MQPNDITFFQRFQDDILAGRKTVSYTHLTLPTTSRG